MSATQKIIRPEGCICIQFKDTGGFRIADLTCPVHGVGGTSPGDDYWETGDARPSHLWPCGCLKNDAGAHRAGCPDHPEGALG